MSDDHRLNTAIALKKPQGEVANIELISHWLEFHQVPILVQFQVEPEKASEEEQGWLFT